VTLNLAVSRSRPPVPYGANFSFSSFGEINNNQHDILTRCRRWASCACCRWTWFRRCCPTAGTQSRICWSSRPTLICTGSTADESASPPHLQRTHTASSFYKYAKVKLYSAEINKWIGAHYRPGARTGLQVSPLCTRSEQAYKNTSIGR